MQIIKFDTTIVEDSDIPRIGGAALIGGREWPRNPDGEKLVLILSIPISFLGVNSNKHISVFTTYDKEEYFLDLITYHGDEEEFNNIINGYTSVLIHEKSDAVNGEIILPALKLEHTNEDDWGSNINPTDYLQAEELAFTEEYSCKLQLYGGDFPDDYKDIFYLSDAIGYLLIDEGMDKGLFFVQAT